MAVLLFAAACGDAPEPEPSSTALVPGAVVEGLRLSARLDVSRGLIRYRVENVGGAPFLYTHRHLGDVLQTRREDESAWVELVRRPEGIRFVSGLGPTSADLRTLVSGGFLPRDAFYGFVDQRRFTPNEGNPRPGLDVPPVAEEFTLDLLDFVWPEELEGQVLELRIVQVHPDWSEMPGLRHVTGVRIPSAILRLDLAALPTAVRVELDRGPD